MWRSEKEVSRMFCCSLVAFSFHTTTENNLKFLSNNHLQSCFPTWKYHEISCVWEGDLNGLQEEFTRKQDSVFVSFVFFYCWPHQQNPFNSSVYQSVDMSKMFPWNFPSQLMQKCFLSKVQWHFNWHFNWQWTVIYGQTGLIFIY